MVNKRSLLVLVGCFVVHGSKVVGQSRVHAHGQAAWSLYSNGEPTPDTTSAWRYYPFAIGNAWEYKHFFSDRRFRAEVDRDTTIKGRNFFIIERVEWVQGQAPEPLVRRFARFDTTESLIKAPFPGSPEGERTPFWAPCPFDSGFGETVFCPGYELSPYDVSGSYDYPLAFGGSEPGTGTDTVRTSVKTYDVTDVFTDIITYAAGIGEIYVENKGDWYGIYYARIDG